jgi:hypothetical protein
VTVAQNPTNATCPPVEVRRVFSRKKEAEFSAPKPAGRKLAPKKAKTRPLGVGSSGKTAIAVRTEVVPGGCQSVDRNGFGGKARRKGIASGSEVVPGGAKKEGPRKRTQLELFPGRVIFADIVRAYEDEFLEEPPSRPWRAYGRK